MTQFDDTASSRDLPPAADARPGRLDLFTRALVICALPYTVAAIATTPPRPPLADTIDVFAASAVPGIIVTVLLRRVHPTTFDRRMVRRLLGVTVAAAAIVACTPLLLAGLGI